MKRCALALALATIAAVGIGGVAGAASARSVTCHIRYTERVRARHSSCRTARRVVHTWVHTRRCLIGDSWGSRSRSRCMVRRFTCRARLATAPPPDGGTAARVACVHKRSRITFFHPI